MNGYTYTYRSGSDWGINPSPPLPTIQRFPPSPSPPSSSSSSSPSCTSDSPSYTDSPYSRFDFDFDFEHDQSSHSSLIKSLPSVTSLNSSPLVNVTLGRPRKAPLPPVYSPRRARARHIRMQEPAKLGLFTVSEEEVGESSGTSSEDIETETEWFCDLSTPLTYSASCSSTSTSPSSSESESEVEVETPHGEFDDPFSTPPTTLSITSPLTRLRPPPPTIRTVGPVPTLAAAVNAGTFQPRRPPPLELHLITRPVDLPHLDLDSLSLSPSPLSFHCQLSSAGPQQLAPALPIRDRSNSSPSSTTPQKRRSPDSEVDLVSALEELLTSCGEDLNNVSVSGSGSEAGPEAGPEAESVRSFAIELDDFPLPPSRSMSTSKSKSRSLSTSPNVTLTPLLRAPITPPPSRLSSDSGYKNDQPPAAPRQKQRRMTNRTIKLDGNHSFLLDMARSPSSTSTSSSQGSRSSSGSGRSLPRRGSIPTQWANPI